MCVYVCMCVYVHHSSHLFDGSLAAAAIVQFAIDPNALIGVSILRILVLLRNIKNFKSKRSLRALYGAYVFPLFLFRVFGCYYWLCARVYVAKRVHSDCLLVMRSESHVCVFVSVCLSVCLSVVCMCVYVCVRV
jgi:hypothetical protein